MLSVIKLFLTSNNTDIQHAMLPQLMCELYSLLNEEYTLELEKCDTKPFCIRLFEKDNEWCWSVTCFGRKAYENIILPLTDRKFSSFVLPGSNDMRIKVFFSSLDDYGKNFLYNLLFYLRNSSDQINIARYLLSRMEPKNKKDIEKRRIYREFSEKLYRWILNDKDRKELITAIYLYAYLTRVGSKE